MRPRARSSSSTCRSRRTAETVAYRTQGRFGRGEGRSRRQPGAVRRAGVARHAAHRHDELPGRRAPASRTPRSRSRAPSGSSGCRTGATRPRVRLSMEARFAPDRLSHNVIGEIRGPRASRRGRDRSAATSTRGTWDRAWWTTPAGCMIAWEAVRLLGRAGAPAAPHRARGDVDERGKRPPRRDGLPRLARRRTSPTSSSRSRATAASSSRRASATAARPAAWRC